MKKLKSLIIILLILMPVGYLKAATLYLDTPVAEYGAGDQVGVDVRLELEPDEECVNTVETAVEFPGDLLEAIDFSVGEAMLTLWIERPATSDFERINREHKLRFTGGLPGGYCGKIPGDQGVSNSLGKLIFKVKGDDRQLAKLPKAELAIDRASRVLQNNGLGSEAKVAYRDLSLVIKPRLVKQKTDWTELKATDYLPPESFEIELLKDPVLYDGQYYLMFNTVDKQSGLDHYEVSEQGVITTVYQKVLDGLLSVLPGHEQKQANWQLASAPYLLKDQNLKSVIKVKAVDKAGNQVIAERSAQSLLSPLEIIVAIGVFVLLLVVAALAVLRFHKRIKSKSPSN